MIRHRLVALVVLLAFILGATPAMAAGRSVRSLSQVSPSAWGWLWQQASRLVAFVGKAHGTMDPNGSEAPLGTPAAPTDPVAPSGTDAQGSLDPNGSH